MISAIPVFLCSVSLVPVQANLFTKLTGERYERKAKCRKSNRHLSLRRHLQYYCVRTEREKSALRMTLTIDNYFWVFFDKATERKILPLQVDVEIKG